MKIIKIIKKLLCIIGIHDWHMDVNVSIRDIRRTCKKCGCSQRGSYDMMYGTINWEN